MGDINFTGDQLLRCVDYLSVWTVKFHVGNFIPVSNAVHFYFDQIYGRIRIKRQVQGNVQVEAADPAKSKCSVAVNHFQTVQVFSVHRRVMDVTVSSKGFAFSFCGQRANHVPGLSVDTVLNFKLVTVYFLEVVQLTSAFGDTPDSEGNFSVENFTSVTGRFISNGTVTVAGSDHSPALSTTA